MEEKIKKNISNNDEKELKKTLKNNKERKINDHRQRKDRMRNS